MFKIKTWKTTFYYYFKKKYVLIKKNIYSSSTIFTLRHIWESLDNDSLSKLFYVTDLFPTESHR